MGKLVLDTEAAFIRMLANRLLRFTREAEARGERYNPVGGPTPVMSGYRARLRHEPAAVGHQTVCEVWPKQDGTLVITEAAELASELLATPAKLRGEPTDHLQFVTDA
jgi:hypothetical protein